ncbi:MAG: hypothetical protein IKK42_05625 [Oscillospiraceae bacterium]|nr:hypothetical protein [Oscillospiraceae bacterium]
MTIGAIGVGISGANTGFAGRGVNYAASAYGKNKAEKADEKYGKYSGNIEHNHNRISEENDRKRRFDSFECQTCENRRYQDGSTDMGVSFQTPTKVDPKAAAAKVKSHEMEHVGRNQAKAEREGREIVSQSVSLKTAICPECGRVYISGGLTRTTTRGASDSRFNVGMNDPTQSKGGMFDIAV